MRQLKSKIEQYMRAAVDVERFTGAILVARNGKPIISKGYGLANVEHNIPNTPQTVFRIASLTKQFTAASIMMLKEQGKLDLSDPFCKFLPDCPPAWQPITIRHLLTMTSGIPGITAADIGAVRSLPIPHDQWLAATRNKPLDFAPGTEFRYANSGYTLLGLIIERLSGKPYGDFLAENIFEPLGMKQTGYENPLRIIPHRATGYRQLPGDPITNVRYRELVALYSAGGIYSTTEDLLRWDQALYTEKLLSRKSIEEMGLPRVEMRPGKSYAYGFWTSTKNGRQEIAHGGNLDGFITYIARYPSDKVTVIVLSNNGAGSSGKISDALSSMAFNAPYEIPRHRKAIQLDAAVLNSYVGEYEYPHPRGRFVISNENGKLFARRNSEANAEMFAESPNKFFLKTEDIQFTFLKDANGATTGVVIDQGDGTVFEVLHGKKVR